MLLWLILFSMIVAIILLLFWSQAHYHITVIDSITELHANKDQLVIVSSHYKENLRWLRHSDIPVVVCSKVQDSPLCEVNTNKGNEVTAYLKFIIQNYDNLPNHVAFIHGHERAWHQHKNLFDVINCVKYREHGFVSLNNYFIDDRKIESNVIMKKLHQIWDKEFRPYLKRDPPTYLCHDCCAQFIVSKERILKNSREAYQAWYDLVINDSTNDNSYEMGRIFEYIWHIIFGEPDVVTQEEYQVMFGECF